MNKIEDQIQNLTNTDTMYNGEILSVKHKLIFSMVDRKVFIFFFLNTELIKRFGAILSVIASGCEINTGAFDKYTTETARLFVNLYPWYYMPFSVHKILIPGSDVIRNAILPFGIYFINIYLHIIILCTLHIVFLIYCHFI